MMFDPLKQIIIIVNFGRPFCFLFFVHFVNFKTIIFLEKKEHQTNQKKHTHQQHTTYNKREKPNVENIKLIYVFKRIESEREDNFSFEFFD